MARCLCLSLVCVLLFLLATRQARAESYNYATPEPGSEVVVIVLTFGPGDEAWEKFGHNAICIIDPYAAPRHRELTYNWGTFRFDQGFYWKFIQGRLLYEMTSEPAGFTIPRYEDANRAVYEQRLHLTPKQKLALREELLANDTDEKRFYLYHYYRNNCSSRVRDVIDDITDHRLSQITKGVATGTTYRWHTDRLIADVPWLYVALKGVLGQPVDRPIDRWDEMFLPEKLHDRLKEVTVVIDGKTVPLVDKEIVEPPRDPNARPPEPEVPPVMVWRYLGVGLALAILLAGVGHFAARHWSIRSAFCLLSLAWMALMAVGGLFIAWAWLATDHDVCRPNENVLHVSVLAAPMLVFLPMLAFGSRRGLRWGRRLMAIMVAVSLFGVVVKALPMFYQANWVIVALCLPPNAAIAYTLWKMGKVPTWATRQPPTPGPAAGIQAPS